MITSITMAIRPRIRGTITPTRIPAMNVVVDGSWAIRTRSDPDTPSQVKVRSPSPVSKRATACHSLKVKSPLTPRNWTSVPPPVVATHWTARPSSLNSARSSPASTLTWCSCPSARKTASSWVSGRRTVNSAPRKMTGASTSRTPPTTNHVARGRCRRGGGGPYGGWGPYGGGAPYGG